MAGTGVAAKILNQLIHFPFGLAVQTISPALLLAGLFSRLAAVPLLIQAVALHGSSGPSEIHLFWAVLLLRTDRLRAGNFFRSITFSPAASIPRRYSRREKDRICLRVDDAVACAGVLGIPTALDCYRAAWRRLDGVQRVESYEARIDGTLAREHSREYLDNHPSSVPRNRDITYLGSRYRCLVFAACP